MKKDHPSNGAKPNKRQRKAVYLDAAAAKKLETVKQISSYAKPKDTVVIERALEYALYNKQDLKEAFERLATRIDIDKNNKKYIGKLNSMLEQFQIETFENHQFILESLKALIAAIEELKKAQSKA